MRNILAKILFLTTKTSHHIWFENNLSISGHDVITIHEKINPFTKYDSSHIFHKLETEKEMLRWFPKQKLEHLSFTNEFFFDEINSEECNAFIKKLNFDLVFVFGTSKLSKITIDSVGVNILNFHGGDISKYRGLDTNLWALWHGDLDSICVTLHKLEEKLDSGDIIAKKKINFTKDSEIVNLRGMVTEECFNLASDYLKIYKKIDKINSSKNQTLGRYYSAMPTDLKEIVYQKYK